MLFFLETNNFDYIVVRYSTLTQMAKSSILKKKTNDVHFKNHVSLILPLSLSLMSCVLLFFVYSKQDLVQIEFFQHPHFAMTKKKSLQWFITIINYLILFFKKKKKTIREY